MHARCGNGTLKTKRRRRVALRCARCGCTERRACPGGCAWDPIELKRGRRICTTCTGRYGLASL